MYRTIVKYLLILSVVLSFSAPAVCLGVGGKRLVTINDVEYTTGDFTNWWKHWNDKNTLKFPKSLDEYIEFQLMVQQGLAMGYDTKSTYLHKLNVFLQVRAMMALKYEEIDSKANVTEDEIKKYYDENFSLVRELQILAFASKEKAQSAYDAMLPYKGNVAGRLVFADLYGGDAKEKADTYDEVKVSIEDFHKNKKSDWIPIVEKLEVGDVSEPFSSIEGNKYFLIRLVSKLSAPEGDFQEKKQRISEFLYKQMRNQLTAALLEKLKTKYNVKIDKSLYDEIKLDAEYPREYLERKIITMDGFEATVADFIYSSIREKNIRKSLSDEEIKGLVLDSIISQTLINKESLARGYENRPPLRDTYEFYMQTRLRAEVEAGIFASIVVSDEDLQKYYELHVSDYSIPDKYSYFLLEGDEDLLKKVWIGTLQGGDFVDLANKYSLDAQIQTNGVDSLAPLLVTELKKLDKGDVGLPFVIANGKYGLLKLLNQVPGEVQPFNKVKQSVLERIKKDKFEILKAEYIAKLKSRSLININEGVWHRLSRELDNDKKD